METHAHPALAIQSELASQAFTLQSLSHQTLSADELRRMDAYWRAANYLSVGQIFLTLIPITFACLKSGYAAIVPKNSSMPRAA